MADVISQLLRRLPSGAGRGAPVIGADLDRDCVRLVQLEARMGQQPRVLAAARRDLLAPARRANPAGATPAGGADEAALDALSDLLRRGNFRGRRVVVALPRALAQYKTLRLSSGDDLARQLAREARAGLGVDVTAGEHVVHFLPGDSLRRGADAHQEGILVVVRKRDVEDFLARVHAAGANVAGLDLDPLTFYRGVQRFQRRRRDAQDVQVIVEVGERATQVIIGRGGRLGFLKSVSIGTATIYAAVARKLDLPEGQATSLCRRLAEQAGDAFRRGEGAAVELDPLQHAVYTAARASVEDLARELSLCLRYYCVTFKCKRPERVLLCGGVAEDPRLCATLAAALPVPVEPRRPLLDLNVPASVAPVMEARPEEWSRAVGLALRFAPVGLAGRAGLSRETQAVADESAVEDAELEAVEIDGPGALQPMPYGAPAESAPSKELANV